MRFGKLSILSHITLLLFSIHSAMAQEGDEAPKFSLGFTLDGGEAVVGKYLLSDVGAVCFVISNSQVRRDRTTGVTGVDYSEVQENSDLSLMVGYRRYLAKSDVSLFYQVSAVYAKSNISINTGYTDYKAESNVEARRKGISLALGGEYFFIPRFSLEASVGYSYLVGSASGSAELVGVGEADGVKLNMDSTASGFYRGGLMLNYYW